MLFVFSKQTVVTRQHINYSLPSADYYSLTAIKFCIGLGKFDLSRTDFTPYIELATTLPYNIAVDPGELWIATLRIFGWRP